MPDTLKDKIAILTGASRGIGAAIAFRFAAEGARVLITARTAEPDGKLPGSLVETAARIRAAGGVCEWLTADLTDPASRARIVPTAVERFGGLDVLVNNAAWARFRATLEQQPKHAHQAFEVNFFAPLELAQQAVPVMRARGGGWILNLSSATSRRPEHGPWDPANRYFQFHRYSGPTIYGSTKAALERMSAGLAMELAGSGIAVNTLAPVEAVASEGAIESGVIDDGAHYEPMEAMAEAALALCSGDPARLTGRCVLSLPLLRELGATVRTLDGRAPLAGYSLG
jgi:NAD(P)-dependent dehydrogenase (short-subunit alcohol dehydrogenase family)